MILDIQRKEMDMLSRKGQTIAIAAATLVQLLAATAAQAGPVLSFRANYGRLTPAQCMQRGVAALRVEGIPVSDDATRINNTSFIGGESAETSAIVDCSEVANSGRVTIIVSTFSNERNAALGLAERLLGKVLNQ